MSKVHATFAHYLGEHIIDVIALVLVWRGVWFIFDQLDVLILGGNHTITAVGGLMFGLLLLYSRGNDPL